MTKKHLAFIFVCIIIVSAGTCTGSLREKPAPIPLKFALIGNTYPESPFSFSFSLLSQAVSAINAENPLILFHTGNMVHGGMDWMGINKRDMIKQYREIKKVLTSLTAIFYPLLGEKDLYNNSDKLFAAFSARGAVMWFTMAISPS